MPDEDSSTTLSDQSSPESGNAESVITSKARESSPDETLEAEASTKVTEGDEPEENLFTDPKDLPDELKPHFKRMQASFTKKMQSAKELSSKAAIVDQFNSDPQGFTRKLMAQVGIGEPQSNQSSQNPEQQGDFSPGSWGDVFGEFEGRMQSYLNNHFAPVLNEVKEVKQKQIESILDEEAPEWREYDDEMVGLLQTHPTLARDTRKLIQLAIPKEVIEGRAMQKALQRIDKKGKAAQVSKGSSVSKPAISKGNSRPSFAEAVRQAKSEMG